MVLKPAQGEDYNDDLKKTVEFFKTDFNVAGLKTQLELFSSIDNTVREGGITAILNWAKSLSRVERSLFSEIIVIIRLLLVMPATNAVSERGFSAMRRIKSFLRSTMSQQRLNHLMILSVHKEKCDKLKLSEIANDFVSGNENRLNALGYFWFVYNN